LAAETCVDGGDLSTWTLGDTAFFFPAEGGDGCGRNISGKSVCTLGACRGGLSDDALLEGLLPDWCALGVGAPGCWLAGTIG
jgi:hypothetical protein